MDNWEQQDFRSPHHQIANTFWQHETIEGSVSPAPSHQVMGKIFRPLLTYIFLREAGRSPRGGWRALRGYYSGAAGSKPAERGGCSFLLVLGGVSLGVQPGRAVDRAVTPWDGMK